MKELTVQASAKLNLTLDITGRREDGYHLMKMVLQSVGLCDELTLRLTSENKISLSCSDPQLPCDKTNLAYRAADAFYQKLGRKCGTEIHIKKRIPMQAGLGGGSADAAAVLCGLNALFEFPFSLKELQLLGKNLGADIPFCLQGGTALAEGIGELLTPVSPLYDCFFVIAKPDFGMSTPECFARFDKAGIKTQFDTDSVLNAISSHDLPALGKNLFNALEPQVPFLEIGEIKQRLLQAGALGSCMTGSGTAVFGLFDDKQKAREAVFSVLGPAGFSVLTQPTETGCKIIRKP